MRIILREDQMPVLMQQMSQKAQRADGAADANPQKKKIDAAVDSLKKLLDVEGKVMINIENGKEYLTYEIYSLANTIGKRYCICRLIKDGKAYGTLYTRPLTMFKHKNY